MNDSFNKAVKQQLSAIISSSDFMASQRMKNMLTYIVQKTLDGEQDSLKGYTIALDVFGMSSSFDPRVNPIVRLEAARLRARLDHYYLLNPNAPVYISIPKGKYIASFSLKKKNIKTDCSLDNIISNYPSINKNYLSSILILPISCTDNTPQANIFATSLQNELSSSLTRCREFKIIDYDNFFQQNNSKPDIKNILKEDKARFMLKGHVQVDKGHYKIWFTLIDGDNGYNVCSENFSGIIGEQPVFQISEAIACTVTHNITDKFGQIGRILYNEYASGQFDSSITQEAYILHWRWTISYSRKHMIEALKSVEKAAKEDPVHITTQAILADLYASDWEGSYNLVKNSLDKSMQIASQATMNGPECQLAHLAMALNYFLRGDKKKLVLAGEHAFKLNPYNTNTLVSLSHWYGLMGMWKDALEFQNKLNEMHQAYPGFRHAILAIYNYLHGNYEEAIIETESFNAPEVLWDPLIRLLASIRLQKEKKAQTALEDVMRIYPDFLKAGFNVLSRYIPNQKYLNQVCSDLEKGGITFQAS